MSNFVQYKLSSMNRAQMSALLIAAAYFPFLNQHNFYVNSILMIGLVLSSILQVLKIKTPKVFVWFLSIGSAFLVFSIYGTMRGLNPGIELLTILALAKSFEINDRRDFFILTLIIELTLIGHLLSVESLMMVLYVLVISFLLFFLLFSFHRNEKMNVLDKKRVKVLLKIFGWSVPLTIIMFIVFPRVYIGSFFPSSFDKESKIGFSKELNPGDFSKVVKDKTPIFRAKFLDSGKLPTPSLYWRGMVLGQTDGFNWKKGVLRKSVPINLTQEIILRYQVDFDILEPGPIFTLENTRNVKLQTQASKYFNTGGTFSVLPYSNHKVRFIGEVAKPKERFLPLRDRDKYLQLPDSIGDRAKEFARNFLRDSKTPRKAADNLMDYFFQNKFVYTLDPGSYSGDKPFEWFFFESRRGFCEHYASTTAILFRLFNIPTRVITGFHGGYYNNLGDYYLITGEDAHAWVEAWFEDEGWVRFDPTAFIAPSRIERGASEYFLSQSLPEGMSLEEFLKNRRESTWKRIWLAFDMVYYRLNQEFLNYDLEGQLEFFKKLGIKVKKARDLFFICIILICLILPFIYLYFRGEKKKKDKLERYFETLIEIIGIEKDRTEGVWDFQKRLTSENTIDPLTIESLNLYIEIKYSESLQREEKMQKFINNIKKLKN